VRGSYHKSRPDSASPIAFTVGDAKDGRILFMQHRSTGGNYNYSGDSVANGASALLSEISISILIAQMSVQSFKYFD
jgi:hypothetical protein